MRGVGCHRPCALLGPLAVSSYLAFVRGVAEQKEYTISSVAERTNGLVELYERLGCERGTLIAAIECLSARLLDRQDRTAPNSRAEACIREAGMAVR